MLLLNLYFRISTNVRPPYKKSSSYRRQKVFRSNRTTCVPHQSLKSRLEPKSPPPTHAPLILARNTLLDIPTLQLSCRPVTKCKIRTRHTPTFEGLVNNVSRDYSSVAVSVRLCSPV
ncbi:hypothetical protein PILCRDRAFT_582237 [Piloderma croceum F 1598]|uniref:Uncharacterized protein n=1 Tax=Piloderma croceum (strain F 1598) TaxID=765440 RepID=A0A0C3BN23_PILCF|nr:hypothetical protein PILCRDRAFT_582237 [Piloderma croceum F 1598]